jgi:HEAT repeat protein
MTEADSREDTEFEDLPIPTLVRKLSVADGGERERARKALVRRGTDVIDSLEPLIESSSVRERWEGTKTLAQLRKKEAAPLLARAMDDDRFDVHWVATEGLIYLGMKGVPAVFRALVEKAHSVRVRDGASRVLGEVLRGLQLEEEEATIIRKVVDTLRGFHPVEEVSETAYQAVRALED